MQRGPEIRLDVLAGHKLQNGVGTQGFRPPFRAVTGSVAQFSLLA